MSDKQEQLAISWVGAGIVGMVGLPIHPVVAIGMFAIVRTIFYIQDRYFLHIYDDR